MMGLTDQDQVQLRVAEGWLGLRDHIKASKALDGISAQARAHPEALRLRWEVFALRQKWAYCLEVAKALVKSSPTDPSAWRLLAKSYAGEGAPKKAFKVLAGVAGSLGDSELKYDLACYACAVGKIHEARQWLEAALKW